MKESYIEGLASRGGPESCAGVRKDAGEALTGVHMGGVLSRENHRQQGADVVASSGRQNAYARQGECIGNPARSKTLRHVWKLYAREPGDPLPSF